MEPKQKQLYSDCYTSILNIKSRDKTANEMYGTKHAVFGGVRQITQRVSRLTVLQIMHGKCRETDRESGGKTAIYAPQM